MLNKKDSMLAGTSLIAIIFDIYYNFGIRANRRFAITFTFIFQLFVNKCS